MIEVNVRKDGVLVAVILADCVKLTPDMTGTWSARIIHTDGRISEAIASAPTSEGELGIIKRIIELESKGLVERR